MTSKTAIQIRILRKYGFLPVFAGDVDFTNVRSAKKDEKRHSVVGVSVYLEKIQARSCCMVYTILQAKNT